MFNVIDAWHVNNIVINFLINFFTVCLKFKTSVYNTYIVKFVIYLTINITHDYVGINYVRCTQK